MKLILKAFCRYGTTALELLVVVAIVSILALIMMKTSQEVLSPAPEEEVQE